MRRDGKQVAASWTEVVPLIRNQLQEAVQRDGSAVAGVLSPFLTCEEAYLLAKFLKGLSGEVRLALGPIPVVGEDDAYPKDCRGRPIQPVKFTIRAEKCPNRRGVEEVLRHFQGDVIGFDAVMQSADTGKMQAVYVAAGYPPRPGGWITEDQATALAKTPLLIVQDLLPSPASRLAGWVIPSAAWAEKDGTFVNHAGLAQAIRWAVTPVGDCRSDAQTFLDLMERGGLVHAPTLRKELAGEVPFFAPLAETDLGEQGVYLQSAT
jgi:NADH-quinone oxidoreductase subunit G